MEELMVIAFGGTIYALICALGKETGFIFSTKRMGWVMTFIFGFVFLFALFVSHSQRLTLIKTCVDNNITLPQEFSRDVKNYKVQQFEKELK